MKLLEILHLDFCFEDMRGTLAQISHESIAQVNAVFTKKGAKRGNFHYHKQARESFYILSGKISVTVRFENEEESYLFKTGDYFCVPENVAHQFEYLDDTYLVVLYSARVEMPDGTKDIHV